MGDMKLFHRHKPKNRPRFAGMSVVSILPKRRFRLTPEAMRLLGDPEAVQFYYDREDHRIGFKGSDREAPEAKVVSRLQGKRSAYVSARRFLGDLGLDPDEPLSYRASMEDGLLVISLRKRRIRGGPKADSGQ